MFYLILLPVLISAFLVINKLLFSLNILEKFAYSYLLGIGVLSLATSFEIYLTDKIILTCLLLFALLLLLISIILTKPNFKIQNLNDLLNIKFNLKRNNQIGKLSNINFWIFVLMTIFIITVIISSIYWPVTAWDSVTLYDFRGQIYAKGYQLSDIYNMTFRDWDFYSYYFSYPLFTSVLHTINYLSGGPTPMIYYGFFYISLIIIFFYSLRSFANFGTAILFTLLLLTTPSIFAHSMLAYSNLPYSVYFVASFFLLYRYIKLDKKIGFLILAGIFTAIANQIRSPEPFYGAFFLTWFIFIIKDESKKFRSLLILGGMAVLFVILGYAWSSFFKYEAFAKVNYSLSNVNSTSLFSLPKAIKSLGNFVKLPEILSYLYSSIIPSLNPILFFSIIGIILLERKKIMEHKYLFLFIFINFGLLVFGTLYVSYVYDFWKQIGESVSRISMFLIPILLFTAGLFWKFPSKEILNLNDD